MRRWEERSRQREHRGVCRDEGGRMVGNEVSKEQGWKAGVQGLAFPGQTWVPSLCEKGGLTVRRHFRLLGG